MDKKKTYTPKEINLRKLEAFLKKMPQSEKEQIKITKDKQ